MVAIVATWPLALHPTGGFYGFGNDNLGGRSIYGWVHAAAWGDGKPSFNPELQFPFGYPIPEQALQPFDRITAVLFGGPDYGLLVLNVQVFASFVLSGCTMYLLVRYLTGSRAAAAVAGFIFSYSPYHLTMSMQYGSLASIQWFPLYVLALLVAFRTPSWRNCALAGAALALVWYGSYYYGCFTVIFTVPILLAYAAWRTIEHRRRDRLTLRDVGALLVQASLRAAVAAATFIVLFLPAALTSLRTLEDDEVVTSHPLSEAIRYSARPWTLVLPTFDNPVFGRFTERTIVNHLYDMPVHEQSLYLGVVAVGLAAVGLFDRGDGPLGGA